MTKQLNEELERLFTKYTTGYNVKLIPKIARMIHDANESGLHGCDGEGL